jgi:hypothetical protein
MGTVTVGPSTLSADARWRASRAAIAAVARAATRDLVIWAGVAPMSAARWRRLRFGAVSHRALSIGVAAR